MNIDNIPLLETDIPKTCITISKRNFHESLNKDKKWLVNIDYLKLAAEEFFSEWIEAVTYNCAEAQFLIGLCFQSGIIVNYERFKVLSWYEKAANQGLTIAMCYFSEICVKSKITKHKKVEQWLHIAAEDGNAKALFLLANKSKDAFGLYMDDINEVVLLYQSALKSGYEDARKELEQIAKIYDDKFSKEMLLPDVKSTYEKERNDGAFDEDADSLLKGAKSGHTESMYKRGIYELSLLEDEEFIDYDDLDDEITALFKAAVEWIRRAAQKDHQKAILKMVSIFYDSEYFFEKFYCQHDEGLFWLKKAAEIDNLESIVKLGGFHFEEPGIGESVNLNKHRDPKTGEMLLKKAIEKGAYFALFDLATVYENLNRHQEAINCYKKLIELGSVDAISKLSQKLEEGDGITMDEEEALYLKALAAQKGDPWSIIFFAKQYMQKGNKDKAKELLVDLIEAGEYLGLDVYENILGESPDDNLKLNIGKALLNKAIEQAF